MGRMKELFMQLREQEEQNCSEEDLDREYWENVRVSQQIAEHEQSEKPEKTDKDESSQFVYHIDVPFWGSNLDKIV